MRIGVENPANVLFAVYVGLRPPADGRGPGPRRAPASPWCGRSCNIPTIGVRATLRADRTVIRALPGVEVEAVP